MAGPVLVGTQTNAGTSATSAVTVTLGSAITAGNLLMVVATTGDTLVPGTTSITDTSGSNVWTRLVSQAEFGGAGGFGGCAIFVCLGAAAGSYGVTFTHSAPSCALSLSEFNPNGQAGTDGTNSAAANTTGTPDPGTVTTTNANDSIFAGVVNGSIDTTWTAGAGYTLLATITSAVNTNVGAQYQSFSTTVSGQSTAFGNSSTNGWTACAAAVKAVSAAGGTVSLRFSNP